MVYLQTLFIWHQRKEDSALRFQICFLVFSFLYNCLKGLQLSCSAFGSDFNDLIVPDLKEIMIYQWTVISPCRPECCLFCFLYIKCDLVRKAQMSPRTTAKDVADMLEKAGTRESLVKQGLNHQNQKCFALKMKNTLTIKGEAEWDFGTLLHSWNQ